MGKCVSCVAKRCKGLIQEHKTGATILLVILGIIAVIAFFVLPLIIVQYLFRHEASEPFYQAKWSAGDALSYVVGFFTILSTAVLSWLAVWQNKRIQEENKEAQSRLEKLNRQSNEYAIKSQIITFEMDCLARLRKAFDEFESSCNYGNIFAAYADYGKTADKQLKFQISKTQALEKITSSRLALFSELKVIAPSLIEKNDPLILAIREYSKIAMDLLEIDDDQKDESGSNQKAAIGIKEASDVRRIFLLEKEAFWGQREEMMRKTLYGTLSLEEIIELYNNFE